MKKLIIGLMMGLSMAANAGLWEGIKDENFVYGSKIAERDLLGKVVVLCYLDASERGVMSLSRLEAFWKSFDHKRFHVVGSCVGDKDKSIAELTKLKVSFPVYNGVKLVSDTEKRTSGSFIIVNQYGKILAGNGMHGGFTKDHEQILAEAVSEVGLPPNLIPGVTLDKYKSLKTKLKLGSNLKSVIKGLEKDVEAAGKKSANAAQKAKAEEASSILSALKDGKSTVSENIAALSDINPVEAYTLLSLYVKSFPEEAADNKAKLAELKTKAAEFKKQAK